LKRHSALPVLSADGLQVPRLVSTSREYRGWPRRPPIYVHTVFSVHALPR